MTDTTIDLDDRPRAPVEWRAAAAVSGVDFADRIIELVVVPYEQNTVVEYPPHSARLITESVAAGAFDGVERRPGRIKANRDHDVTRTVGLARAIHTTRSEGLVSELYISKTSLGDETLQLADDGVLGASVGMAVRPSDQVWSENRSRRRIVKAFLDHIALVPNPAYQGAEVLAVRASELSPPQVWEPAPTPYLDEVLAYLRDFRLP
jgi:HK97 family phage prohead protease